MKLRRVEAWVEVDGALRVMVFITNNTDWSPRSVCDLYRRRWDIEVFFKQVKQSLKLGSFLGHSAPAMGGWRVRMGHEQQAMVGALEGFEHTQGVWLEGSWNGTGVKNQVDG